MINNNKIIIKIVVALVVVVIGIVSLFYFNRQKNANDGRAIREKAYVAVEGGWNVAVINMDSKKLFKKIDLSEKRDGVRVFYMPHNVEVAPDNKTVWVTANAMGGMKMGTAFDNYDQIIVIDPVSDTIVKRVDMGKKLMLSHIVLTPDNSYALAVSQMKDVIYKINAKTFEIERQIEVKKGGMPHGLRISPDGKTAYIALMSGKSMGILDIEKMTLEEIPLKGEAVQTGVTPDGKYALASIYDTKSLAIYEIESGKLSYIDLPESSKGPVQIYPTPDSRFVYVADQGYYFNQPKNNLVYKIDLLKIEPTKEIKVGDAPHGVIVSPDGKTILVTNLLSKDVSIIDVGTDVEIKRIKVGERPNGISLWYSN